MMLWLGTNLIRNSSYGFCRSITATTIAIAGCSLLSPFMLVLLFSKINGLSLITLYGRYTILT